MITVCGMQKTNGKLEKESCVYSSKNEKLSLISIKSLFFLKFNH